MPDGPVPTAEKDGNWETDTLQNAHNEKKYRTEALNEIMSSPLWVQIYQTLIRSAESRSERPPPLPARPRRARTHPQVVEGDVGEPLSGDVLAELLGQSGLLLGVHGQHRARDQLLDAARGKVPRLDPHQVVEGELDDEAALGAHLEDGRDEPEGGAT